jgi:hypothetical protein
MLLPPPVGMAVHDWSRTQATEGVREGRGRADRLGPGRAWSVNGIHTALDDQFRASAPGFYCRRVEQGSGEFCAADEHTWLARRAASIGPCTGIEAMRQPSTSTPQIGPPAAAAPYTAAAVPTRHAYEADLGRTDQDKINPSYQYRFTRSSSFPTIYTMVDLKPSELR